MRELAQNRGFAAVIAIVVVVLTIFVSGSVGLNNVRTAADVVFYRGSTGNGLSIGGDLESRLENAYNIGVVARRYRPESSAITDMEHAYNALTAALKKDDRELLAQSNRELATAVDALYTDMSGWGLDETDTNLIVKQYRSFLSAGDTISHDSYNDSAREFNDLLKSFPASLISGITGIMPLPLFV